MGDSFYGGILDAAKNAAPGVEAAAVKAGTDYVKNTADQALNIPTVDPVAAKTFNQPPNQTSAPSPDDPKAEIFGKGGVTLPDFAKNKYLYMALGAVVLFAVVYYVKRK